MGERKGARRLHTKHSVDGIPQGRRSQEASNEVATEFREAVQQRKQHNSAKDTAAQEERSQLTAVRMDVHQPTLRSWRRHLVCDGCPESEAAVKTLTL